MLNWIEVVIVECNAPTFAGPFVFIDKSIDCQPSGPFPSWLAIDLSFQVASLFRGCWLVVLSKPGADSGLGCRDVWGCWLVVLSQPGADSGLGRRVC